MRGRVLALALSAALAAGGPAYAATSAPGLPVQVTQDKAAATAVIGGPLSFTTTIRNTGDQPLHALVAHLNILSLDPSVYVDPEDWSSDRTQYVAQLAAHGSRRLSWTVHAVNKGRFIAYVAVATSAGGSPVAAGPALRADVSAPRMLDAAGVLPTAVAVPVVLLALLVAARVRRRRLA